MTKIETFVSKCEQNSGQKSTWMTHHKGNIFQFLRAFYTTVDLVKLLYFYFL